MLKFCKILPAETLKMSLGEIYICIDEGWQEYRWSIQKHVDLKCAMLNGPWSHKKDQKLYEWKDFLPKELLPEQQKPKELTPEEQAAMWSAAGNAYVNQANRNKKIKVKRR